MRLLKIVPEPSHVDGAHLTLGTKVLTPSGERIEGVSRIVLIGDCENDVWRAQISCLIQAPEITCLSSIETTPTRSRWQRLLQWIGYRSMISARAGTNPPPPEDWRMPPAPPAPPQRYAGLLDDILGHLRESDHLHTITRATPQLFEANEMCRAAYQIALRDGADTNWPAFRASLLDSLHAQSQAMLGHPVGAPAATCTARTYRAERSTGDAPPSDRSA